MTEKELKLLDRFLEMLIDKLGDAGCNEMNVEWLGDFTVAELRKMNIEYNQQNGTPEAAEPDMPMLSDYCYVELLREKLKSL